MGGVSPDQLAIPFKALYFILVSWLVIYAAPKPPDVNYRIIGY